MMDCMRKVSDMEEWARGKREEKEIDKKCENCDKNDENEMSYECWVLRKVMGEWKVILGMLWKVWNNIYVFKKLCGCSVIISIYLTPKA